mmetsp:Transcript_78061/g.218829  ORF Transcript_78061/g.218829 Transcript_78061/m.218829 type:complete len:244 (+) Transcript_78061:310-1041(+)
MLARAALSEAPSPRGMRALPTLGVLPHLLEGVEGDEWREALAVCLVAAAALPDVLQEVLGDILQPRHPEDVEALFQPTVLRDGPAVEAVALLDAEGEDAERARPHRLDGPVQAEDAVVQVHPGAGAEARLMLHEKGAEAVRQEDGVRVDLDGPSIPRVLPVTGDGGPDRHEDPVVQRCLPLPPVFAMQVDVDATRCDARQQLHSGIAVYVVVVAPENACAELVLQPDEALLVALQEDQDPTEH